MRLHLLLKNTGVISYVKETEHCTDDLDLDACSSCRRCGQGRHRRIGSYSGTGDGVRHFNRDYEKRLHAKAQPAFSLSVLCGSILLRCIRGFRVYHTNAFTRVVLVEYDYETAV